MCAPKRCKTRPPRYLRKRMVPMNAARRHVCEQAAENRHLQMQGISLLPRFGGYGNRRDMLGVSLTRMVELDVTVVHTTGTAGRTQGAHKEAAESVRIREATKRRRGHRGTPMQLLRMRPTDDWGTRPRNRSESSNEANEACCRSTIVESVFIRNLKTELSVATVK